MTDQSARRSLGWLGCRYARSYVTRGHFFIDSLQLTVIVFIAKIRTLSSLWCILSFILACYQTPILLGIQIINYEMFSFAIDLDSPHSWTAHLNAKSYNDIGLALNNDLYKKWIVPFPNAQLTWHDELYDNLHSHARNFPSSASAIHNDIKCKMHAYFQFWVEW